jgi:hypothetical protein
MRVEGLSVVAASVRLPNDLFLLHCATPAVRGAGRTLTFRIGFAIGRATQSTAVFPSSRRLSHDALRT